MAKQLKAILIAIVVVVIAYYTFGLGPLFTGPGWAAALHPALQYALATAVMQGIGMAVTALTSEGIEASRQNFGAKVSIRDATSPRQVVYGQTRVGGIIVHMQTSGTDRNKLSQICLVAGHPIEGFTAIHINNQEIAIGSLSTSTVSGETVYSVTGNGFVRADNENNFGSGVLIRFTFHDGTQTARDGLAAASLGNTAIPTTHKYTNCAYFYIEMIYDHEQLAQLPRLSFQVKGKKCYDPRTDTTVWTDNPALIVRDFLVDQTYGLKCLDSELNDATSGGGFAAAANVCDQNITLSDGSSTEKRYRADGFTNFAASGAGVLEALLTTMAGKVTYTNGKFNVFAGSAQTPSLTITDDDLLAPVSISTRPQTGDMFNSCKAIYVDKNQKYQATDAPVFEDSTYLGYDTPDGESTANYKKTREVQLPFTTSVTMADRIAKIGLRAGRQSTAMSIVTTLKFMRLQPGDWVYITNERFNWTAKIFEVTGTAMELMEGSETAPGFLATKLDLRETAASVFNHAHTEYGDETTEGSNLEDTDTTVSPPTVLVLSTYSWNEDTINIRSVVVLWTNAVSSIVTGTEVSWKLTSAADTTYRIVGIVPNGQRASWIGGISIGQNITVRVRHISTFGSFSTYLTGTHTVAGTTTDDSDFLNSETNWEDIAGTTDAPADNATANPSSQFTGRGTSFPGSPVAGQYFFRTDENKLYIYSGSAWLASTPADVTISGQGTVNADNYTDTAPTQTSSGNLPDNATVPVPNPMGSTWLYTGATPYVLYFANATDWVTYAGVNTDTLYTLPTYTSGSGVPNNNTTPSPNPLNSTYLNTATDPDTLYISDGSDWVLQSVNSDTLYTLPTFTTGSGVPNNSTTPSPNPAGSSYLNTATDPDTLYISNGTSWVLQGINSDTLYVLPTWTTGSGVPSDSTTPSPNPLGSSYLRTGVTPNTLYISNGSSWILQAIATDLDTLNWGLITITAGAIIRSWSTEDQSSFLPNTTTATVDFSINHPSLGTFSATGTWTRTALNISGFALSGNTTGNDAWTSATFGSAAVSKTIVVTHTASSRTISLTAFVIDLSNLGGCLLSGSMIKHANGTTPIEDIEIGQRVLSYDLVNEKEVESRVSDIAPHRADYYYRVNNLSLTAGHPIWTRRGWCCVDPVAYHKEVEAYNHTLDLEPQELQLGDELYGGEAVEEIVKVDFGEPLKVWNIIVENTHTYIADDVLVHNGGGGGGGKCLTPAMLPEGLKIGDYVDSPPGETKVVDIIYKQREGYYLLEGELEITNDHPILFDGKWINAEEYQGNKIYKAGNVDVVYVETENELLTVKGWVVGGKY